MEIAIRNHFVGLSPKILNYKPMEDVFTPNIYYRKSRFFPAMRINAQKFWGREGHIYRQRICAVLSGVEDVGVSSSQFEDFSVTSNGTNGGELKIRVEISGARTRAVFDEVFDKMVAEAQPIPGFRRVKGGQTPNIPRDILLEVLGPSNVYKQVIMKVINSTIAEYVEKGGLEVSRDIRVEQSYEDLEEMFEPDEKFSFDAVLQLQQTN
ncbi:hypothetical protein SLA2020_094140 [Shorea laevis]